MTWASVRAQTVESRGLAVVMPEQPAQRSLAAEFGLHRYALGRRGRLSQQHIADALVRAVDLVGQARIGDARPKFGYKTANLASISRAPVNSEGGHSVTREKPPAG